MPGNYKLKLFPGVLQNQLGDVLSDWMTGVVAKGERYAKERTPVDTGRLRSSISGQVEGTGTGVRGRVGTNVEYAPYVEFGTFRTPPRAMLRGGVEQALTEET